MAGTMNTAPEAAAPRGGDFQPAPGVVGLTGRLRVEVVGNGAAILSRLELLDIPGRWDRRDAFGRARLQS